MAAIQVAECGKCYRIYPSPRARLLEWLCWDRVRLHQEFWALRGVSFDVPAGQAVGVIGLNGSGKSTLLQLIAGVMPPTEGRVQVRGRVGAILELGAGFNPEFTGRQNSLLYGSVLGLTRAEVLAQLDEIRAFADIGEFFDRPVKLYSSGMYSRLAFAVTTQLRPDVLIVDEALAVGDALFQRKCMTKLDAMRSSGTTIFFVSHALDTVKAICDRAILLHRGQLVADGSPREVGHEYGRIMSGMTLGAERPTRPVAEPARARTRRPTRHVALPQMVQVPVDLLAQSRDEFPYGNGEAEVYDLACINPAGEVTEVFESDDLLTIRYRVRYAAPCSVPIYGMTLTRLDGVAVYGLNTLYEDVAVDAVGPGDEVEVEIRFPFSVVGGNYYLTIGVCELREGRLVYLHRRCDTLALKVLPAGPLIGVANLHGTIHAQTIVRTAAAA